ncbi:MAG: FAD-binding oxidoreductase [Chloroflexota bacterium]
MVKQASLASDLASIVGREGVSPGSGVEAVDGIAPKTVVRPGSYDEVAAVLRYANDARLAVIPLGGHLHAGIGNAPHRYDVALEVTRLDQVVEFEPADLTITVEAGMTLGALRRVAADTRMMVPFDPELPDEATVGGVLAAALSGPARVSLGAPRDVTIGMRVVTADGKLTRAGGRVVKNVAGYDLCKLYIGSMGTLGVIVEATFKTVPLPLAEETLAFGFPDPAGACAMVSRATAAGLSLRSARLIREAKTWRLEIGLAGMAHAVARSARELRQRAGDPLPPPVTPRTPAPRELAAKLSVLPTRLPVLLGDFPSDTIIEAHPATGICHIAFAAGSVEAIAEIRSIARKHGATCVIEMCPPDLKRDIDVFGDAPSSLPLMRAIKAEFDPNGVLSPGRMLGKI